MEQLKNTYKFREISQSRAFASYVNSEHVFTETRNIYEKTGNHLRSDCVESLVFTSLINCQY